MKRHRLAILVFASFVSLFIQGQLFKPLGLGSEKCGLNYNGYFQPQIHVEGDILYACTNQGLYSKDLSDEGSTWQLVGFEGLPLQDYARKGDSILVLRYNENESYLLLSNDGGQTYEDITPEMFCKAKQNVYLSLVQHPTDSNTLLASSWGNGGIFQSRDFGQTWESLFNDSPEYIGYHPLTPEIIYESGSNIYGQPEINISYDAGQTWQDCSPYYPGYNNWNDVFRVAFHPTNSNRWVVGGWGCVYISDDNGHTWNTQNVRIDGYKLASPLRLSLFDDKNNDIVYMAGFASGEIHVMCSMDGGTTWNVPHIERAESIPEIVTDLKQYGDKLLIYSESDVYEVSKAELIEQTTSADVEINEATFPDEYFRNWVLAQPYGQDGVLTDEEIAGVTKINVMRREVIQSLKGIEYFTAITKLVCEMNQLTELDLSKNIKLTSLTCYGNQLTELDLSNNKELTYLACEGNELTTLDVSGFTKLKELDCQQNPMITLNVSGCSSLTTLKCYLNQLTELDVSGCAKLDTIWCEYNQLTELDVSSCTSLTFLWCEMNQLTKLDVTNNTKLRKLLANDNQLAALNLSKNKLLQYLRTYNNQIKGKTMDALIENLPIVSHCGFCPVFRNDEVDVMNAAQVAAAKSKGFIPYYWNEEAMRWMEYTGEVPPEPITFTEGRMATIILPTEPDASKGKYYRLDRVEEGQIIFEQELQPQAHVPYIIVPSEDFSIDLNNMDLEGLSCDTASIGDVSFIGSYVSEELEQQEGCNIQFIDTTPDCSISFSEETGKETFLIGALRAYLTWDDPYNQGGTKGRGNMEIVLLDYGTSIEEMKNEELRMKNDVFDLSGRKIVNGQSSNRKLHGIYIENGLKRAR